MSHLLLLKSVQLPHTYTHICWKCSLLLFTWQLSYNSGYGALKNLRGSGYKNNFIDKYIIRYSPGYGTCISLSSKFDHKENGPKF